MRNSLRQCQEKISSHNFRIEVYRRLLVLFLVSLFLTIGQSPILSQLPAIDPINPSLSAPQLVEQGKEFYAQSQFPAAAVAWQQAVRAYQNQGDKLHQAMVLTYVSLAYQQLQQWFAAQEAIATSLELLERLQLSTHNSQLIFAQALNARGQLELALGQSEAALLTWQQGTKVYEKLGDRQGITGSLINQAQAMEALGLYRRTCKTLLQALELERNCDFSAEERWKKVLQTFEQQPNNQLKVLGLRSLGNILRLVGALEPSQQILESSLQLIPKPQQASLTLLSLGKTERDKYARARDLYNRTKPLTAKQTAKETALVNATKSLDYYQQAAAKAANIPYLTTIEIQAQLHRLSLLIDLQQWLTNLDDKSHKIDTETLKSQIESQVADLLDSEMANLPPSPTAVYAQLHLVQNLSQLKQQERFRPITLQYASKALQLAQTLKNRRAESHALGILGSLYEPTQQWSEALAFTERALLLAQAMQAPEIAYQWQWQLGRIYQAQKEMEKAIAAYEAALETLESVRGDLLVVNSDIQFSFRDNVEPVYRQLVDLLLQKPIPENLAKTRKVIQLLQLAELENFLQCSLQEAQPKQIDALVNRSDSTEAILYPIILDERIEMILKLPQVEELRYYSSSVPRSQVEQVLERLQENLAKPQGRRKVQIDSQQVYRWLIKPLLADLESNKIDTLVFLLDAPLRNIPMAALYDGEDYLIQNYAVAVSSGLQLLEPRAIERGQLQAILAGITESRQGYRPLTNVDRQFEQIQSEIPSEVLLDRDFNVTNFQNQLESLPFPVVHIATHGQFSSQPEETFIIAWDERLDVNDLSNLLKSRAQTRPEPIELLVLAACQTAKGDKRATLGLAGVAINAGARSTLATLWKVIADESPGDLLSQFYKELRENRHITKAEALRRAQLEFLKDESRSRPYFWAPYVLLGNWL